MRYENKEELMDFARRRDIQQELVGWAEDTKVHLHELTITIGELKWLLSAFNELIADNYYLNQQVEDLEKQ